MYRDKLILLLFICFLPICLFAQTSFTVSAPSSVELGQQFKVVFELRNASEKRFSAPKFEGFDILFASSDVAMIRENNRTETLNTHTYVLLPKSKGKFTIGAATVVTSDNKSLRTKATQIAVVDKGRSSRNTDHGGKTAEATEELPTLGAQDVFVRIELNKSKAYEQEEVIATYKLYIDPKLRLRQVESVRYPEFEGFVSQPVYDTPERGFVIEKYNGRYYNVVFLQQWVVLAQRPGQLNISPAEIEVEVSLPRKLKSTGDPMQDFLNASRGGYLNLKRHLKTSPAALTVIPLPLPKPAAFDGAVGEYMIKASVDPQQPATGEAMTIRVEINGRGNIKLLKEPKIQFPESFDTYDPKAKSDIQVSAGGSTGSKVIEYYAVPNRVGSYSLPPVEMVFFDPATKKYKRIATDSIQLKVKKGKELAPAVAGSSAPRENVRLQGREPSLPRFEIDGSTILPGSAFAFSPLYWSCYLLVLSLGVLCYFLVRQKRKMEADIDGTRKRRAAKLALEHLTNARNRMQAGEERSFYDALLTALWGYLGDKLLLPLSDLKQDKVEEKLQAYGAEVSLIARWKALIQELEFARFASVDTGKKMEDFYQEAAQLIDLTEKVKVQP